MTRRVRGGAGPAAGRAPWTWPSWCWTAARPRPTPRPESTASRRRSGQSISSPCTSAATRRCWTAGWPGSGTQPTCLIRGGSPIMTFQMIHENYNVSDLEKSLAFYGEALGTPEVRRNTQPGFTHRLSPGPDRTLRAGADLAPGPPPEVRSGRMRVPSAFAASDFEAAHKKHQEMGCICYENDAMGIYFIEDPDGYWLEIVPVPLSAERGEGSEAVECAGSPGRHVWRAIRRWPRRSGAGPRRGTAGRAGDRAAGPGDCGGRGGPAEK